MTEQRLGDWESRMSERHEQREVARYQSQIAHDRDQAMAQVLPRLDAEHCAHGLRIGDNPGETMVYACPLGDCVCCEQVFPYIGDAMVSSGPGGSHGHWNSPNPNLCPQCGGQVAHEEW